MGDVLNKILPLLYVIIPVSMLFIQFILRYRPKCKNCGKRVKLSEYMTALYKCMDCVRKESSEQKEKHKEFFDNMSSVTIESKTEEELEEQYKDAACKLIYGKLGTGEERKIKTESIGLSYNKAQEMVNKQMLTEVGHVHYNLTEEFKKQNDISKKNSQYRKNKELNKKKKEYEDIIDELKCR